MDMDKPLAGKVAIVTGSTRGIGRAIATALAAGGASVVVSGRNQQASLDAAREVAAQTGGQLLGQACDVTRKQDVVALFDTAEAAFGGVDIVVNNAGVGVFQPMASLSDEDWRRTIDTNLTGVFYCSREAVLRFRKRGGGYLFQIGSLAGRNPFAGGAAYNASKFGLRGFSEAAMLDHRYENVRVTTIAPGSVDTDFSPRSSRAAWKIQPEDIARIVVDLLAMPARTLVSYVEVRPSQPAKG
jgi:NAD(P)-dependent dehydrogenase (short-subunit alcohol dehydrogenase family)